MTPVKRIRSASQWLMFAVLVGTLGGFSFVGLPWLAQLAPVKGRMELNAAKQIDGGATFYTDQPFLEKLLAKNEAKSVVKKASSQER